MAYKVKNAEESDLVFIYFLFESAIEFQIESGGSAWLTYDRDVIKQDIYHKRQFKIVFGSKVAAVFSLFDSDKPVWGDRENGEALYLHRIIVHAKFRGRRLFGEILNWAIGQAQDQGRSFIRIDTWADNHKLIDYYQSFGFKIVGSLTTSNSEDLPEAQRNNPIVLLEYVI